MKFSVEKLEKKNQAKITFTVSSDEWEQAIDEAYHKTKGRYKQPGFRPGKVPRAIIERNYGKGVFFEDAIDLCFPKYYEEALSKNEDIFPVDRPQLAIDKIDDDGLVLTATVTVKPEVTLGEYKGIKYKMPATKATKKELDAAIDAEREKLARIMSVEDRAVENGDIVNLDYSGSMDGKKFDGGTAEKQELTIGSKTFIPGFEEQLIGMSIGEEKDIEVTFPEDYHSEDLKGKPCVFHVKINEIKKKELPKLDDEFAKDVSEFNTLKEYKEDLEKKLNEKKAKSAAIEAENDLLERIAKNAKVDIPPVMIDNEVNEMVQEMSYRMMYQGLKLEDYLKYTGSTMETLKESYKKQAEKNVKLRLVIDKIIKTEKIEADQESVDAKIKEGAKTAKKTLKEYKDGLNEWQLSRIKNEIITDKLFVFLKANNTAE